MPLTPVKYKHIVSKIAQLDLGRTQTITLTLKLANNATTTMQIPAIFRLAEDGDPTLAKDTADAVMQVRAADVTLAQLRAAVFVDPAPGSVAAQLASRYLITSIAPKGLGPDPDRYICTLDRQR